MCKISLSSVGFLFKWFNDCMLEVGEIRFYRSGGTNSCEHYFSSHVGIGSNSHYLTGVDAS